MEKGRTLRNVLLLEKKRKIGGGIYHKMQVDFAYNSNHIEGSQLSHEQTRYIFETHSIDGTAFVDDVIETANHFKCFDFVLDTIDMPITEEYVKSGQLSRLNVTDCPVKVWTQLLIHKNKWRSAALNAFIDFYKEVIH